MLKIAVAALMATAALPAAAETSVVTATHLLDVASGRTLDDPVIVITDGRITSVATDSAARAAIPAGATRIDLPGKTLLPGLIDMHVHLDADARISGFKALEYTDSFWAGGRRRQCQGDAGGGVHDGGATSARATMTMSG